MVFTGSQAQRLQQALHLEQSSNSSSNVEPEQVPELSLAPEWQLEEQVDLDISPDSESKGQSVLSVRLILVMTCLMLINCDTKPAKKGEEGGPISVGVS